MKNRTSWIALTAAGCLLGAFVGHKVGRSSIAKSDAPPPAAAGPPEEKISAGSSSHAGGPAAPMPGQLVENYAAALADRAPGKAADVKQELASLEGGALLEALAKAAKIRGSDGRREVMHVLLARLAELDPNAAIQYLANETSDRYRYDFTYPVFGTISEKLGAASAFDFYLEYRESLDGQSRISSLFPIFSRWQQRDIAAAIAALPSVVGEGARRQAIISLSEAAAHPEKRERLLPWALALDDPNERAWALEDIAAIWSRLESPDAVLNWVAQNGLGETELLGVERGIAETKLDHDPPAAATWLMSRASDETRSEHLAFIVKKWANLAPNAAGEWLGQQELDAGADKAVSDFAWTVARDDPESAFAWAKTITDSELRDRTIERVMRYWQRSDPAAAAAANKAQGK